MFRYLCQAQQVSHEKNAHKPLAVSRRKVSRRIMRVKSESEYAKARFHRFAGNNKLPNLADANEK